MLDSGKLIFGKIVDVGRCIRSGFFIMPNEAVDYLLTKLPV